DRHRHFSGTASLPGPQFRLTPIRVTAIALGALNVLLWMHYFASDTGPAPPPDAAYTEASMRWAMVLTSERIDDFRRVNHRTPTSLAEIGRPVPAMVAYERIAEDRYRLTGPTSHGPLVFDSMSSRSEFQGTSLETLRERTAAKP